MDLKEYDVFDVEEEFVILKKQKSTHMICVYLSENYLVPQVEHYMLSYEWNIGLV